MLAFYLIETDRCELVVHTYFVFAISIHYKLSKTGLHLYSPSARRSSDVTRSRATAPTHVRRVGAACGHRTPPLRAGAWSWTERAGALQVVPLARRTAILVAGGSARGARHLIPQHLGKAVLEQLGWV